MLALVSMASGEHIDIQREKRWPNRTLHAGTPSAPQTGAGVKVNFDEWEEDEDFSDQEGVCGPIVDLSQFNSGNDEEVDARAG